MQQLIRKCYQHLPYLKERAEGSIFFLTTVLYIVHCTSLNPSQQCCSDLIYMLLREVNIDNSLDISLGKDMGNNQHTTVDNTAKH